MLHKTLNGLLENTHPSGDEITIGVSLNRARKEEIEVCESYMGLFGQIGIEFLYVPYGQNIGKANSLNKGLSLWENGSRSAVITMDNDMVIKEPWMEIVRAAISLDKPMVGFSSATFWAHLPIRLECASELWNGYVLYRPYAVAGGMLLFQHQFLKDHPWTNHGGVYGRDDATMCEYVEEKIVIHSDNDWLDHDPWGRRTAGLRAYDDSKKGLYSAGKTVFSPGWDE